MTIKARKEGELVSLFFMLHFCGEICAFYFDVSLFARASTVLRCYYSYAFFSP